jgi:hypothetical protein
MSFFDDKIIPGLHCILATILSGYAFIFKKNNFDFFYLFWSYFILLHWTFLNGECAISYYFKKQKDKNYVAGKDLHNDEFKILLKEYVNIIKIFFIVINILLVISVYITFKRNNIPSYISISFLSIYEIYFYGLYFFSNHYKNENFFIFQNVIRFLIILNIIFTFIHFSKNFTL